LKPDRNKLPYYAYSSYNKRGGMTHPTVARRINQVMDMWAALMTAEQIAEALDLSARTVEVYIAKARRRNDPRATRPHGIDRRSLTARIRRTQIRLLAKAGFSPQQIAKRIGTDVRLVQMRLKEPETVE